VEVADSTRSHRTDYMLKAARNVALANSMRVHNMMSLTVHVAPPAGQQSELSDFSRCFFPRPPVASAVLFVEPQPSHRSLSFRF
jgi:hypothetical protein